MIHIQFLEKVVLKLLNMSKAFTLELNKNPYSWYLNELNRDKFANRKDVHTWVLQGYILVP